MLLLSNSSKKWMKQFDPKDHLISKDLFVVFNFLQKTNQNKSHSSRIEFLCSFFGRNVSLIKSFRFCLTFSAVIGKKMNSFFVFLEESSAWKKQYDFVWPLEGQYKPGTPTPACYEICQNGTVYPMHIFPTKAGSFEVIRNSHFIFMFKNCPRFCSNAYPSR